MVAGNELGVKVFHTGPTFDFFFLTFGKKCEKNYFKMNNYIWIQKKLHKFALSSQFMREATFDFESSFRVLSESY